MQIDAITDQPSALVGAIDKAIEDGKLRTWARVVNAKKEGLYSHVPEQWNEKAMLKPYIHSNKVSFLIRWWNSKGDPGKNIQGYILGRFVEVLMVHFPDHFTRLEVHK